MHGGYKDNRRRVLTFNTLTAQKLQNMCGDVQVTFSARYWVRVYLAELISDRVSSVEWGAKWGVGPSLFGTYFGREMFGNGLPIVGTYTEILGTSWVAMKAIVVAHVSSIINLFTECYMSQPNSIGSHVGQLKSCRTHAQSTIG